MSDLDPSTFPSLPQLKALRVVDLKERLTELGLDTKGELMSGKRLLEMHMLNSLNLSPSQD